MNTTFVLIGWSLPSLFSLLVGLAVFCLFPIRNAVECRIRPWAAWGIMAATVLAWLAATLADTVGRQYGFAGVFEQFVFARDFSQPWTLLTSLFVPRNVFQLFLGLWLFQLLAPVLEERFKSYGLLLIYFGGGAATAALHGLLAQAAGIPFSVSGMAPGLFFLIGFYLVLYPFEDIVFFYNLLFFVFSGTIGIAMFYLVAFALLLHAISAVLAGTVALTAGTGSAAFAKWLGEAVPLLGLALGFLAAALKYGLGAFIGRTREEERNSPGSRMLQRALARMTRKDELPAPPRLSRRERAQSRQALSEGAPPEEIEAFAEQCLRHQREELLETAYIRFRGRFPKRSFGPGLQAVVAQRFEQAGRTDLAVDAYRLLIEVHGQTPVAADARLRLARLLAKDPTAAEQAIEQLELYLRGDLTRDAREEARALLDQLIDSTGRGETYNGLGPHKTFRFSKPAAPPVPAPAGIPSSGDGLPIGRAAAQLLGAVESAPSPAPAPAETPSSPAGIPILSARDVVPDTQGRILREWGQRRAPDSSEVAAAMAAARTFAVILLPGARPIADEVIVQLGRFWTVDAQEAAEKLHRCRGVLLDDAPSGRAVVLARKLRSLGLPVTIVPLLDDISHPACEDVLEFAWDETSCGNLTALARRTFGWDQLRLANVGRVALPGAGQTFRLVLDLFVGEPHCFLRFWENTLNFARGSLDGKAGAAASLQPLIEELDRRTPHALKTPSFRTAAKKSGPPLDFHSPAELDHYNRWFLYAAFGKYAAEAGELGF